MNSLTKLVFFLVAALTLSNAYANADYAREKKWADEILPGIVVGDPVYLQRKSGQQFLTLFTETKAANKALIIVHGPGLHPDWGLIGLLRTQLADRGFSTLSVQMPVLAVDAGGAAYRVTFPEAIDRIAIAVDFLHKKNYPKVALVSHSLASDIGAAFIRQHPSKLVAWASLGMSGVDAYKGFKLPILDLYGEGDLPAVLNTAGARAADLKSQGSSKQVMVPKADHFLNQHEADASQAIKVFLDAVK